MIVGKIRIIAGSQRQVEQLATYLNRVSGGQVVLRDPARGDASDQWVVHGRVELADAEREAEQAKANAVNAAARAVAAAVERVARIDPAQQTELAAATAQLDQALAAYRAAQRGDA